jgi:hypothetical protein
MGSGADRLRWEWTFGFRGHSPWLNNTLIYFGANREECSISRTPSSHPVFERQVYAFRESEFTQRLHEWTKVLSENRVIRRGSEYSNSPHLPLRLGGK